MAKEMELKGKELAVRLRGLEDKVQKTADMHDFLYNLADRVEKIPNLTKTAFKVQVLCYVHDIEKDLKDLIVRDPMVGNVYAMCIDTLAEGLYHPK